MTGLRDRFHHLRETLRTKAARAQRSLVTHGVAFAGVNALLLGINAATGTQPEIIADRLAERIVAQAS